MPVITKEEVQTWLERTKLAIDTLDDGLELSARVEVFGAIAKVYDVSAWLDPASTPELVRVLVAMLVAARLYRRQYSETVSDTGPTYADWLEGHVASIIEAIVAGTIDLTDVVGVIGSGSGPIFWPDETTGSAGVYDAAGFRVGADDFVEDIKFRMGMRF